MIENTLIAFRIPVQLLDRLKDHCDEHPVYKTIESPQWIGLDNQIFRELFVKMFGVFSGYEYASDLEEEAA